MDSCPGFLDRADNKFEVFLCFAIQQPEVLHLHCMGTLAFDCVIDNANGSGVVDVNGCWWLWMAEFQEGKSQDLGFLCIEEECT